MSNPPIDLTGQRFGRWTVVSRSTKKDGTQALWNCTCDCGGFAAVRSNRLRTGGSVSCGCYRRDRLMRPDDQIAYVSAHHRVRVAKGKASTHACVDCGETAQDWSLRHAAESVNHGLDHGGTRRWSPDPGDYEPRCKSCHKLYDNRRES